MNPGDTTLWCIRGGKFSEADGLFLKQNTVALGWSKMGDLSKLPPTKEAFKAAVETAYPDDKPASIPGSAGQLYRFVREMKVGDLVAYPSKVDRQVHLGRVATDYRYDPQANPAYPHTRGVTWLRAVSRLKFSQGALYEIGSALTLFLIKNYADEFRAILENKAAPAASVEQDDSIEAVSEDVEETTRDFLFKKLAKELKGHPFAEFVAHLLGTMGYRTRVSPEGPDGGIDIIAHKDELGIEPPIIKVQVKSTEGSVGDPAVSALYGKVSPNEFGLIVALGTFTSQAHNFAKSKSNLRLIDGNDLVELIYQHYDQFGSRYKTLLPLRRVWIPDVIDTDEG